jgi:hypothetical protein
MNTEPSKLGAVNRREMLGAVLLATGGASLGGGAELITSAKENVGMRPSPSVELEVREVLRKFQEGYAKRDLRGLDEFMSLFSHDPGVEIVGTYAVDRKHSEWATGFDAARDNIVASDWKYWGDFTLDVAGAIINVLGDVAWLSTCASVVYKEAPSVRLKETVDTMREALGSSSADDSQKILEVLREGACSLRDKQTSDTCNYPIRLSAVLVRQQGAWRFHHLNFSHAMQTRDRIVRKEAD